MRRIGALDGARAAAIVLVVGFHGGWPGFAWGGRGVDVFFALSGLLITAGLLREKQLRGKVSLAAFLSRRFLRLAPALALFLAGYSLLCLAVFRDLLPRLPVSLAAAASFTTNAAVAWWGLASLVPHTWALALEVQFYLLFPPLVARLGRRAALRVVATALVVVPLWRGVLFAAGWGSGLPHRFVFGPDTRIDGILWGCALALLVEHPGGGVAAAGRRFPGTLLAAALALGLAGAWLAERSPAFLDVAGYSVSAAACALGLLALLGADGTALGGLLSSAPLAALAAISYPLYLWHPACLGLAGRVARHAPDAWQGAARQGAFVTLSLGAAAASWFLVERPLARYKARFARA